LEYFNIKNQILDKYSSLVIGRSIYSLNEWSSVEQGKNQQNAVHYSAHLNLKHLKVIKLWWTICPKYDLYWLKYFEYVASEYEIKNVWCNLKK